MVRGEAARFTPSRMTSMLPSNAYEYDRIAALRRLEILDTDAEPAFDALTRTASAICRCPVALISLVDVDRQWFKSRVGLDTNETPREQAFCAHAIRSEALFEVPDALEDPRFVDNPLVTGAPDVRFYAGQPLMFEGVALGTLCVIDRVPRALDDAQRAALADLSIAASVLLQGRRETVLREREARRFESFARLSGDWLWESDAGHRCTWLSGDMRNASGLFDESDPGDRFRDLDVLDWVGRPRRPAARRPARRRPAVLSDRRRDRDRRRSSLHRAVRRAPAFVGWHRMRLSRQRTRRHGADRVRDRSAPTRARVQEDREPDSRRHLPVPVIARGRPVVLLCERTAFARSSRSPPTT